MSLKGRKPLLYSCLIILRAWSILLCVESIGGYLLIDLLKTIFFCECILKQHSKGEIRSHVAKATRVTAAWLIHLKGLKKQFMFIEHFIPCQVFHQAYWICYLRWASKQSCLLRTVTWIFSFQTQEGEFQRDTLVLGLGCCQRRLRQRCYIWGP